MYHTSNKNQHLNLKSSSNKRLSQKEFQTEYTPAEQRLLRVFWENRFHPHYTNGQFASLAECCTRTVIRATNKFHQNGLITKHQKDRYSTNHYTLNEKMIKGSYPYTLWLNSLSPDNQYLYNTHGIIVDHKNKKIISSCNVTPKSSSLILDSLFSRNVIVSSRMPVKKGYTKYIRNKKQRSIVNEIQKQLILDNRNDPNIKEIINKPTIKAQIITPAIEKITTLLTLSAKEQLKLVAFTDETLEHVHQKIVSAIYSKKVPHIQNRMEWLVLFATEYCSENDIKPDWRWYYDLCDIMGISSDTEMKPFVMPQIIPKPRQHTSTISPQETLRKLKKELKKREDNLTFYGLKPSVYDQKVIARLKHEISEYEGGYNEKQSISNQCSTFDMVQSTA